jgi:AcrR family transcriptional regulator
MSRPAGSGEAARTRIFQGAVRCIVERGATASMAEIASSAGVSKALLHYHHADRAHLLAEVVARIADRLTARERAAMEKAPAGSAVDAHWAWLAGELRRGELRALLELGTLRDAPIRAASEEAAVARRTSATRSAESLFASLGLVPRMPAALIADASTAFIDGLAIDGGGARDPRVSFDLFWLALLSLGE